ncbi:hypothetical protein BB558_007427, partial [Smittium angustum]
MDSRKSEIRKSITEPSKFDSVNCSDPTEWISRYELHSRKSAWTDEDKVDLLELYLHGKDLVWYKRNKDKFVNWVELKKMFLEKYEGKEVEILAWNKLQRIKQ